MVTVVHKDVEHRHQRVENPALNALCLQTAGKGLADKPNAAHVVVKDPHIHAGGGFLGQDFLQPAPRGGILDGVVFHKDKVLRLSQLGFLGLQRLVGVAIESHPGVAVDGEPGGVAQVVGLVAKAGVFRVQPGGGGFVLGQVTGHLLVNASKAAAHHSVAGFLAEHQEEAQAQNGHELDQHNPGQLVGGVDLVAADVQHHQKAQHAGGQRDISVILVQPHDQQNDPEYLQQHTDGHKHGTAHAVFDGLTALLRLPGHTITSF